jgi:hypothetical protein
MRSPASRRSCNCPQCRTLGCPSRAYSAVLYREQDCLGPGYVCDAQ